MTGDGRAAQRLATREHILATAEVLFTEAGYDRTSIPDVLAATGLSRGALYHHFDSKEALFTAVLENVEQALVAQLAASAEAATSPADAVIAGCRAFLRRATDPAIARIVLIDAPAVIGWDRWRQIDERHAFGLLKAGMRAATDASSETVELRAHILLASLLELALVISRSAKPRPTTRAAEAAVTDLVHALLTT